MTDKIKNPYTSRLLAEVELMRHAGENEMLYLRIRNAFYMACTNSKKTEDLILARAYIQQQISESDWVEKIFSTPMLRGQEDEIIDAGLNGVFEVLNEKAPGGWLEDDGGPMIREAAANALVRVAHALKQMRPG